MINGTTRFIRVGDTLINLSQIIDITMFDGLPESEGEVQIRTTAPDAEVHIFDGEQAAQLRAFFNGAGFDIDHVVGVPRQSMPPFGQGVHR